MSNLLATIDDAIADADKVIKFLCKSKALQIRSVEERQILKAVALGWLRTHRGDIKDWADQANLTELDSAYKAILSATDGSPSRKPLVFSLKDCRKRLITLRSELATIDASAVPHNDDKPPNFAPLASDLRMQDILIRRWHEVLRCLGAEAYLAATVMMGGLLEALLLARVESLPIKTAVFTAASTPKDSANKTRPQKEWTLRDYIDIAHELGWITKSAKDVGEVLRDYRNFVHPYKEYSHKITLVKNDGIIFWGVTKTIASQVIESI